MCVRIDVRDCVRVCVCVCVCVRVVHRWPDDLGEGHLWGGDTSRRDRANQSFVDAHSSSKPSNLWSCWSFEGDCLVFPPAPGNANVLHALCLSWAPLRSNCLLWLILERPGVISYTNKVPLKEIREICMNFSLIYLIIPHYKAAWCSNVITSFQFLSLCKRN